MKLSLFYLIDTWILSIIHFVVMLGLIVLGRISPQTRTTEYADNPGNTAIAGAMYALLGLMLAFTFSMSGDRFKERRALIVDEANAIQTAFLRSDLYADSVKPAFRKDFRQYLEARIAYFEAGADTAKIGAALRESQRVGEKLWELAAGHSRNPANLVASNQMVPALTQMFDIGTARFWSEYNRTPSSILTMLFLLSLAAAFVVGHTSVSKGKFDWPMAVGFCVLTVLVVYFIIDLDKPRMGLITLDKNARAIVDLRKIIPSDTVVVP